MGHDVSVILDDLVNSDIMATGKTPAYMKRGWEPSGSHVHNPRDLPGDFSN